MMLCRKINVSRRIIKFEVAVGKIQGIVLDSLTYAAEKLWNVANYERRSWTKESGENGRYKKSTATKI